MLCSRKFGLNREATLSGIGDWRLESVNMVILRGEKDASAWTVENGGRISDEQSCACLGGDRIESESESD